MAVPIDSNPVQVKGSTTSYRGPFALMTLLFFLWGFMTVWNDVLIPKFKDAFDLSYFQAMLVQFAFFGAYAIGGGGYALISIRYGDLIARIGYRKGVILGLLIAALGSGLFYPAALLVSYPMFLGALFIVGLGFAMLQIAANPYITILGPERTASARLNLSQAFNSLGTTVGPLVGAWLIFQVFNSPSAHGVDAVRIPYLILAGLFVILAVLFACSRLPEFTAAEPPAAGLGALRHPHMVLGMIAIFMYVGGEVAVGSLLINYLGTPALGQLDEHAAASYLSFYWGGLMIGRFMGALALGDLSTLVKRSLMIAVPLVAFIVITVTASTEKALPYGMLMLGLLIAQFIGGSSPQRMIALFSGTIIALLLTSMLTAGSVAMWTILGVGLFCSVMWSNIFSLAIEGLGDLKSQASSLLVMAILGGAILPLIQGALADAIGIQASFIVPALAFAYVAFYGLWGYRIGRPQEQ